MQIRPVSMDTPNVVPQQNISFISVYNKSLLKIQKEIEKQPEMAAKTRREMNKKRCSSIEKIAEFYDRKIADGINPAAIAMNKLQLLSIKYSLTAIKCGDTDWETFQVSKVLHQNIEDFIISPRCTLTLDEQKHSGLIQR